MKANLLLCCALSCISRHSLNYSYQSKLHLCTFLTEIGLRLSRSSLSEATCDNLDQNLVVRWQS